MSVFQLIYWSRPLGFDEASLGAILISARHHNGRHDVTGALICRSDIFLQLLEGPEPAVRATYARIERDNRHVDLKLLWSGVRDHRQFPDWGMRHDPARSWLWTPDEVWAGAVDTATVPALHAIFTRIAAEPNDADVVVM